MALSLKFLSFQSPGFELKCQVLCAILYVSKKGVSSLLMKWPLETTKKYCPCRDFSKQNFGTLAMREAEKHEWKIKSKRYFWSSHHSSMVSTVGLLPVRSCYKSWLGRGFINFWLKRKFNYHSTKYVRPYIKVKVKNDLFYLFWVYS